MSDLFNKISLSLTPINIDNYKKYQRNIKAIGGGGGGGLVFLEY